MDELKTTVTALQIVADEIEKLQGVTQAQLIRTAATILELQQASITDTEAQLADALGDGFYDGYMHLLARIKEDEQFLSNISEREVIELSEDYESELSYAGSLNKIKADAGVAGFFAAANLIRLRPERANHAVFLIQEANKYRDSVLGENDSSEQSKRKISAQAINIPDGWKLVPIQPTEQMIINGFESEPTESFSSDDEWEKYTAMSGCKQASYRAKRCYDAMINSAPEPVIKELNHA